MKQYEGLPHLDRDGIIVCLDADCKIHNNYLQSLEAHFEHHPKTPGCAIYFEHMLDEKLSAENFKAICGYELHLRYYTHGLKFCELPCSFQTVGSAMAVRCSAYQKQGGMNKRKAGEDFYFLQKIIKLGDFTELNKTVVMPSARLSKRVPFGTGHAIATFLQGSENRFYTYHPQTFRDLRQFVRSSSILFRQSGTAIAETWQAFPPALQKFINKNSYVAQMEDFNTNTSSSDAFKRRFFNWCDGFLAFKYSNFARKNYYPATPVEEAAKWLLKEAYGTTTVSMETKELLIKYRMIDRAIDNS